MSYLYERNFELQKKIAMEKLEDALRKNLVDEDIISLLEKINSLENYFTTSSCSGRIVVMEMPEFGDKLNAKWLGKWHREVSMEEVKKAIEKHEEGMIWFMLHSPILHVASRSLEDAVRLLNLGIHSGFKNSSIKSVSHKKLLVELYSTERLDIPLGENGEIWVDEEYLVKIVGMANRQLRRAKGKLSKLEGEIERLIDGNKQ
ncbi:tRNA(Phe) 7-((3-amino-3-carboxypropyl)-4-demethylwyosine(37)-N(4))-methyltransferase Taw3 [Palaeococcus sp. (in: euryarchaeotes)]